MENELLDIKLELNLTCYNGKHLVIYEKICDKDLVHLLSQFMFTIANLSGKLTELKHVNNDDTPF